MFYVFTTTLELTPETALPLLLIPIGFATFMFGVLCVFIKLAGGSAATWTGAFIKLIVGGLIFVLSASKLSDIARKQEKERENKPNPESAPSSTVVPTSDAELSNSAPSSTEPTIALTSDIHELHEPLNTSSDSDIIGYTLMVIAALFLIGFVLVLIARKAIVARKARTKLQRQIQHSRDTNAAQLREIMTAFTTESTNPINTLKYQLYADTEHPTNRAYVTAMMLAYKEQQDLDEAIAKYFKHKPEMISTHRFEKAVAETAKCWDMLNEVQQEAQRLITRQREAQQKAQRVVQRYVSSLQSLQSRIQEIDEIFNAAADAETQQDPNVAGTNGII